MKKTKTQKLIAGGKTLDALPDDDTCDPVLSGF